MPRIERALLSVTDKTGLIEFATTLHRHHVELISTGGTAKILREHGLPVRDVAEVTGFPEMLDGRVKTIDPHIAGGILAIRSNSEHMDAIAKHGIQPIQLVVVNLYAFEKYAAEPGITRRELIEHVDIGGPTMIRAAAKNFQDVAVVVSPAQYEAIACELGDCDGQLSIETHWKLAQQAFIQTAAYDAAIASRLMEIGLEGTEELPAALHISARRSASLRYGENPHQAAALYKHGYGGIGNAEQLGGKELSYNNLVDLDAAWQLIQEFDGPAAAIIKHTNPCGCAEQGSLVTAYRKALEADPISAFGGVLAFNRELDEATAMEVVNLFVEAIAAPAYSEAARSVLAAKKNVRVVKVTPESSGQLVLKSISGGYLAQTADSGRLDAAALKTVSARSATPDEMSALVFGWKVAKHVKSNAIVYARPGQIVSVGAGQMSRVDSVKVAAMKALLPTQGCIVASDAFFPFPDGLEEAAKHGITAAIQPGGSIRDNDVIAAADRLGLAMIFTGVRHFRH